MSDSMWKDGTEVSKKPYDPCAIPKSVEDIVGFDELEPWQQQWYRDGFAKTPKEQRNENILAYGVWALLFAIAWIPSCL